MSIGALLVRADVGPQIGSGHFMRCLALAQAWQEHGGTAIFLMAPGAGTLASRLKHNNISEVRLSSQPGSSADAKETSEIALRHQAAWVALDGYQFSSNYQRTLKDKIAHLLLFDDVADAERYYADLLLNQNAYATAEIYGTAPATVPCSWAPIIFCCAANSENGPDATARSLRVRVTCSSHSAVVMLKTPREEHYKR